MTDRDAIHPLALRALYSRDVDDWREWCDADYPLLTPRASAVLTVARQDLDVGMCADCKEDTCEGCANAWMLADAIREAWRSK